MHRFAVTNDEIVAFGGLTPLDELVFGWSMVLDDGPVKVEGVYVRKSNIKVLSVFSSTVSVCCSSGFNEGDW